VTAVRRVLRVLMRGSSARALTEDDVLIAQPIWGLLDHDMPHAGQLSMLLRADGVPGAAT
jgi:hypothetical protein